MILYLHVAASAPRLLGVLESGLEDLLELVEVVLVASVDLLHGLAESILDGLNIGSRPLAVDESDRTTLAAETTGTTCMSARLSEEGR